MDIFEELGVNAYVNAHEWFTSQGGSMLAPPVVQAMAEASQKAVRLIELHHAVADAIARLTQNEAACVTSSATAGILLAVAAFMSAFDRKKAYQLPDTRGLKNEVVIQKCDHFGEEWAIRMPGAQFVDIGAADAWKGSTTVRELEEAITPRTAAVFTTPPVGGKLPVEEIVRIAHERGVGVIVDIAWSLPPKEHLWKFTREYGADVVIVSGGKGLRGPQASGLILGKKEVVHACQQMSSPYGWPGRPMKVGREAMAGIYAAVKHLLNGGAEATQQMAETIAGELEGIPGVSLSLDKAGSQVHLQLAPSMFRLTAKQIREKLLTEEPKVMISDNDHGPNGLRVNAGTLAEGQEQLVARRVKETLLGALGGGGGGGRLRAAPGGSEPAVLGGAQSGAIGSHRCHSADTGP